MPAAAATPAGAQPTTPVFTTHEPYRRALGGLTSSTTRATDARGAVAAMPGVAGWPELVAGAIRSGAAAVLVDDPTAPPPASVHQLQSLLARQSQSQSQSQPQSPPLPLPLVLDRPRLRADLCSLSVERREGAPARAVVVECAGASTEAAGLLSDAVGWGRVLAGGELTLLVADRSNGGVVALLEGPAGVPVTVVFTVLAAPGGGGVLRASALGETRSEVTIDLVAGVADLDTITATGSQRAAPLVESSHRLALRRAVLAARHRQPLPDLDEFVHDCTLAAAVLGQSPSPAGGISPGDLEHRRYVVP